MELLRNLFSKQVISRNREFYWTPRSPDLTAKDVFLWGYLKSKIYTNKLETLFIFLLGTHKVQLRYGAYTSFVVVRGVNVFIGTKSFQLPYMLLQ